MAHKKKGKKKTTHHGKRKMSGKGAFMEAAKVVIGGVVGAGLASVINNTAKSFLPNQPLWIGGAASVVGGGLVMGFAPKSSFTTGVAAGMAGMGGLFVANETVVSVPGISGMPTGLTNAVPAGPGYLKQKVGYRNPPPDRLGVFTGGQAKGVVGKLMSN